MTIPVRSVSLDLARKPQELRWIERLVTTMGGLGLNRLSLHLSDSSGCAVALPRWAHRTAELALDRAAVQRLREVADAAGVEVVPEFDAPSHLVFGLADRPELWLRDRHGVAHPDKLDLSMAGALDFVGEVWHELDEWFGVGTVHLGGDEYLTAPWEEHRWDLDLDPATTAFPQLLAWVEAEGSASNERASEGGAIGERASAGRASYEDAMAQWFNRVAEPFLAAGREVVIWNDHVRPARGPSSVDGSGGAGLVTVDPRIVLDVWIRWRAHLPSACDYARDGHRVINANGDELYFVLSGDGAPATEGRKSPDGIRLWGPRQFMGAAASGVNHELDEGLALYGTQLSVWCDDPTVMSPEPMWQALHPWLVAYAERVC